METAAAVLTGIVALLHIYIFIFEAFLWRQRATKVFGVPASDIEATVKMASNQGCYNAFLAAALIYSFIASNPDVASAFQFYGLACVIVAAIWGAVTVTPKILIVQGSPAILAMACVLLS